MKMTFGIPLDVLLEKKSTFFEETNRQPPFSPERFNRWFPLLANLAATAPLPIGVDPVICLSWPVLWVATWKEPNCSSFLEVETVKEKQLLYKCACYIQIYTSIICISYIPGPSQGCQLNPKAWWIDTLKQNHLAQLSSAARWSLPILWSHQWLSGGAQLNGAVFCEKSVW